MSQILQDSWTPNGRTLEQSKEIIIKSAKAFDLWGIIKIDRIGGNANENYSITTKKWDFVIKIVIEYPKENVEQEANYIQELFNNNFPVIPYIKLKSWKHVYEYKNTITVALKKEKWYHPEQSKNNISEIAVNFWKLHSISTNNSNTRKHWLDYNYLQESLKIIKNKFPKEYPIFLNIYESFK